MNIRQLVELSAGGPGSGRHPGDGLSQLKNLKWHDLDKPEEETYGQRTIKEKAKAFEGIKPKDYALAENVIRTGRNSAQLKGNSQFARDAVRAHQSALIDMVIAGYKGDVIRRLVSLI